MFTTKMFKKIVRVLMKSDSIHEMKKEKTKMKITVEKKKYQWTTSYSFKNWLCTNMCDCTLTWAFYLQSGGPSHQNTPCLSKSEKICTTYIIFTYKHPMYISCTISYWRYMYHPSVHKLGKCRKNASEKKKNPKE